MIGAEADGLGAGELEEPLGEHPRHLPPANARCRPGRGPDSSARRMTA
jgi:hypothetical protein